MDTVNNERRGLPRHDCDGIIMFNVLSDDLNFFYCTDNSCIKGIAQAINMNECGMMMRMVDMLGFSHNLKDFNFNKLKGTLIMFGKPDDGKMIRAEVVHVSDNIIGIRYV